VTPIRSSWTLNGQRASAKLPNPVALPTFPNVTWGTTYTTKGPTYYTVAGTMQEISSNYGQQNSTSKASSTAEGGSSSSHRCLSCPVCTGIPLRLLDLDLDPTADSATHPIMAGAALPASTSARPMSRSRGGTMGAVAAD